MSDPALIFPIPNVERFRDALWATSPSIGILEVSRRLGISKLQLLFALDQGLIDIPRKVKNETYLFDRSEVDAWFAAREALDDALAA